MERKFDSFLGLQMNFVFDVDGTLTPPREKMSKEFKDFFLEWMEGKQVYLLTGSDMEKTIEQVGKKIWKNVTASYQSSGNEVWKNGDLVRKNEWELPNGFLGLLKEIVAQSKYPHRFGNHIEFRTGMINVSTVGRNATKAQRAEYAEWDEKNKERHHYVDVIKRLYKHRADASVGGQISLDVYSPGNDKSQILNDLTGEIHFFGDKCKKGGNDFSIVSAMGNSIQHKVHPVKGPEQTMKMLRKYE